MPQRFDTGGARVHRSRINQPPLHLASQFANQRFGAFEGVAQFHQVRDDGLGKRALDLCGSDAIVADEGRDVRQILRVVAAKN